MKEKTVCFTGHRKIPTEKLNEISKETENIVIQLIQEGYSDFAVGGALGFDTIAAKIILKLKAEYPYIKLHLIIPYTAQPDSWKESEKLEYTYIKQHADNVYYTSDKYFRGCLQKRNRYLVDMSSVCVCHLTHEKGGTAYTVKYAESKKLKIIHIN